MNDFEEIMNQTAEQMIPPARTAADSQPIQPTGDQSGADPGQQPQPPEKEKKDFSRYCLGNRLEALRRKFEDGDKAKPIATGFPRLDELFFGGLRAGLYLPGTLMASVPTTASQES